MKKLLNNLRDINFNDVHKNHALTLCSDDLEKAIQSNDYTALLAAWARTCSILSADSRRVLKYGTEEQCDQLLSYVYVINHCYAMVDFVLKNPDAPTDHINFFELYKIWDNLG